MPNPLASRSRNTVSHNATARRAVGHVGPQRANSTEHIRRAVTRSTYTAADRALAATVRSKLASGVLDSQPTKKETIMTMLATLEASSSNQPSRIPDRRVLEHARGELSRFASGNANSSNAADNHGTQAAGETGASTNTDATSEAGASQATEKKAHVGINNMSFSWDYAASEQTEIGGFRIYQEGQMVAQIDDPGARSYTGDFELHEGSNAFTMTAFSNHAGQITESPHSNAAYKNVTPSE